MNTILTTKIWDDKNYDTIIDVRSPSEFNEDHIPGAINLPVLDDEERKKIGIIYKKKSPFEAKVLGSSLVTKNISEFLIKNFKNKNGAWKPLVYCWRGGQRSKALCLIMREIGWRVNQLEGGYKYYRSDITKKLQKLSPKLKIILISGKTGTGKTKLLNEIKLNNGQTLDLEGIACHKGSLLGKDLNNNQPSQKLFESLLYDALKNINLRKNIYLEAESSKIGNLHIPQPLWKKMLSSKKINIETTFESRVKFLLNDYKYAQLDNNFFKPLINGLKRRLSKKIIAEWKQHIKNKDWKQLTESLLTNHYDPAYISNYEKKNQKIIKNFTINKVTKSELNLLANKILNL